MDAEILSILMLWIFILVYAIAGALDFGTGFWSMIYSNQKHTKAGEIANKYLSPSWEVTNVFLVMFVVTLISFFPKATFTFGTVLFIPGSLILILLAIRTAFLVFAHSMESFRKPLNQVSGITGLLIPALLVVVLPVTHGGYIDVINGNQTLSLLKVFTSPTVYAFIAVALSSTLYISSVFLADYSNYAGDKSAVKIYRKQSLWLGPTTVIIGLLLIIALKFEAAWLYENMLNRLLWVGLSLVVFLIAYGTLIRSRHYNIALFLTILQFLLIGYAYGASHLPYLIYPATIKESLTNISMFRTLVYSYIINTIILIPILVYHWRLFVRNKRYLKQE